MDDLHPLPRLGHHSMQLIIVVVILKITNLLALPHLHLATTPAQCSALFPSPPAPKQI